MAPAAAIPLTAIQSRPLSELIGEMLTTSDDNTAELLVKEIGVAAGGAGSRPAGLAVIQAKLQEWGVPADGLGAGRRIRSRSGRPPHVPRRCRPSWLTPAPPAPSRTASPSPAQTGTLADAFQGSPAAGRLRAKTGTLTGAKALSGFVDALDGLRHISFSYVQNGADAEAAANPIWDALGQALTTYPTAPSIEQLGPAPAAPPG